MTRRPSTTSTSDAFDLLVAAGIDVSVHPDRRRGVDLLVSRDGETAVMQVKVRQKTTTSGTPCGCSRTPTNASLTLC
jgi:hypothetical protein